MGCMLRSDHMTMCDMYLQPEAAFEVLSHLGEMGCVQFIDMHPDLQAFQRNYIVEVCRFAEMERKLRLIENEMKFHNIQIPPQVTKSTASPLQELAQFENTLDKWEQDIQEVNQNEVSLNRAYLELTEFYYVLTYIGPLLGEAEIQKRTKEQVTAKDAGIGTGANLVVITGVVRRAKCYAFEMMLWRISHGIIYYRQAAEDKILIDPITRKEIRKVAFLAICQGDALRDRVQKICAGFRVNTYPCPNTFAERTELMDKLQIRISDLDQVLKKTKYLRCVNLRTVNKHYRLWMNQVRKGKAIYYIMNMFNLDITRKCLIGQCWIPTSDLDRVNNVLWECSEKFQSNVPSFTSKITTDNMPPTFHRTNKFTKGFQALINAYGDSTYRELNPGLYTLITFPFLFAMMFGDIGHGFILFSFGSWMVKNEKSFIAQRSTNEIWNIFFGGRYVITLMGMFSMFTGMFYNDMFSKPFSIRRSYWLNTFSVEELSKDEYIDVDPSGETYAPYPFGIDPIWVLAKNKIMYENSTKMKLSIIIGVIHMVFGIILSFFNHRYFKRHYAIFFQFLPELIFMLFLLFWLVLMMYIKWFMYSSKSPDPEKSNGCAPQILLLFIDMALMSETKPANEGCKQAYMFEGQKKLQRCLVIIALLCIPVLLFGNPVYKHRNNLKMKRNAIAKLTSLKNQGRRDYEQEESVKCEIEKYSAQFGEMMVNQGVHTIEFVLSTISHTASYLRLWALSLAHTQLSEMLWDMILSKLALQHHSLAGFPRVYVIFAIWAMFTIAILVVMEGLSAFLHCLRLHWVEFMSKFYSGGGYAFRPFNFWTILSVEGEKAEAGCQKAGHSEH